jgi:hypothetical protein
MRKNWENEQLSYHPNLALTSAFARQSLRENQGARGTLAWPGGHQSRFVGNVGMPFKRRYYKPTR